MRLVVTQIIELQVESEIDRELLREAFAARDRVTVDEVANKLLQPKLGQTVTGRVTAIQSPALTETRTIHAVLTGNPDSSTLTW